MASLFSHDHREGLTSLTDFCSWAEHREPTEQSTDMPYNRIRQRENKKRKEKKKKKKSTSPKDFQILFWKRQKRRFIKYKHR